eukprot:9951677-Alexandrium_andersonii.AAC.1
MVGQRRKAPDRPARRGPAETAREARARANGQRDRCATARRAWRLPPGAQTHRSRPTGLRGAPPRLARR